MGARTVTDDEVELIYYFHYLSPKKYSISELTTLFAVNKSSICNYLREVKSKIEKDNTLAAHIFNKYKGYESITEYKKDLKENIQEINYNATVRDINKRLIEMDKKIEGLKLPQQPVNPNTDVILQSVADKADKIPDIIKGFTKIAKVLKLILNRLDELKKQQDSYNLIITKLNDIEMKMNQEDYNGSKLDMINEKIDQLLDSYDGIDNDNFYDSNQQPNLQPKPYSSLQATEFGGNFTNKG